MGQEVINNIFSNSLVNQYNWFNNLFVNSLKSTSDEFFQYGFSFKLMSMSLNINAMFQDDSYFVTKINIDAEREVFIRCSEKAIGMILEKVLEVDAGEPFNLNMMTELEAKIITSFNDMFYSTFSNQFRRPSGSLKFRTFDILHLTFLMKPEDDKDNSNVAKIIVSLPYQFIHPEEVIPTVEIFNDNAFASNMVEATIKIGSTLFSLQDLKALEPEDIVVFENSDLTKMKVFCDRFTKVFNITPNSALIIAVDDSIEGEINMEENSSVNLWDSIQVEMGAEFDKVKIPLGDLKKINEGIIVDISSIYNNKVSLKVEEKMIAQGELVIVNDRYGVKVTKVFAPHDEPQSQQSYQPQQPPQPQLQPPPGVDPNVFAQLTPEQQQQILIEYQSHQNMQGPQLQPPPGIDPNAFAQLTPEQQQQIVAQYQQMSQPQLQPPPGIDPNAFAQLTPEQQQQIIAQYQQSQQPQGNENFDYSDFDIDDEDI